jgi:hypothetical protein
VAAPDLIALAHTLAAEGSGLGKSVAERIASGRPPTPGQREALVKIRDERAAAGAPLPPPPGTPAPKARAPTAAEVRAMEAAGERRGMSPAEPPKPRPADDPWAGVDTGPPQRVTGSLALLPGGKR